VSVNRDTYPNRDLLPQARRHAVFSAAHRH
jgi:hypothetical protein